MLFYTYFTLLIFVLLIPSNNRNNNYKKISMLIVTCIILSVVGLRNIKLGLGDTENIYLILFNKIINTKTIDVILNFKDPFFYFLTKIYTLLSNNFQLWVFLCALSYIIPVMCFIYKKAYSVLVATFMFLALNYFGYAFSGLRHCIAMAILLYSFDSLINKKFWKFLIIVCFASLFHITAIIFIISYPIVNKYNLTKKRILYINIFILICFVFVNLFGEKLIVNFMELIVNTFKMQRFSMYTVQNFSSLNNILFFINYLILLFSSFFIFTKKDEQNNKKYDTLFKLQLIGTFISILNVVLGEFNRISMFFTVYSIILIPEAVRYIKDIKTRNIILFCIIIALIIYFLFFGIQNYLLIPYSFFWEC